MQSLGLTVVLTLLNFTRINLAISYAYEGLRPKKSCCAT